MGWHLFVVGLLATSSDALAAFAPIQWVEFAAEKFVLAPKVAAPYQRLRIWGQHDKRSSPDAIPGAMLKSDGTIALGDTDLCVEASGDEERDAVRVNHCTGGPHQLWSFLPVGDGKRKKIQLKETRKCIEFDGNNRDDFSGAPVELRECEDKVTQLWAVDGQAQSMWQHSAERSAPSSSMRLLIFGFSMLGIVGVLSSTGLWWRRCKARNSGMRHRSVLRSLDRGGICLTPKNIPMDTPKMNPAALVVAATAAAEDAKTGNDLIPDVLQRKTGNDLIPDVLQSIHKLERERPAVFVTAPSSENGEKRLEVVINPMCPFAQRAWLGLEESGLQYKVRECQLYPKPSWLLKLNPKGKIPVLIDEEGKPIVESEIILDQIASRAGRLSGSADLERVASWRKLINSELLPAGEAAKFGGGVQRLKEVLRKLDGLVTSPFVVAGSDPSVADISAAPMMQRLFDDNMVPSEFKNLHGWWDAISARPAFKKTKCRGSYWWWW